MVGSGIRAITHKPRRIKSDVGRFGCFKPPGVAVVEFNMTAVNIHYRAGCRIRAEHDKIELTGNEVKLRANVAPFQCFTAMKTVPIKEIVFPHICKRAFQTCFNGRHQVFICCATATIKGNEITVISECNTVFWR